jgi:N-dimethylarginine dimethylaminohydrolase
MKLLKFIFPGPPGAASLTPARYAAIQTYIAKRLPLHAVRRKVRPDLAPLVPLMRDAWTRTCHLKSPLPAADEDALAKRLIKDFRRAALPIPFDAQELTPSGPVRQNLLMSLPWRYYDPVYDPQIVVPNQSLNELKGKLAEFRSWLCMKHALVKAGSHIEIMEPAPLGGLEREVFTRDRFVLFDGIAYLPDIKLFKFSELREQRELLQAEAALKRRNIPVVCVPGTYFEGGNILRHPPSRTILVGVEDKNNRKDARRLVAAINTNAPAGKKWSLLCVPLVNATHPETGENFLYHLDTGLSEMLPHGEILISPQVTSSAVFDRIVALAGGEKNIIRLSEDETKELATNFTAVGKTIVMTGALPELKRKLEKRGYKVAMPSDYGLRSFESGQGGVHCMTNELPASARRPVKAAAFS